MPTNVFGSSLAPQLLSAWPYLPIHPASQSTSCISLIKLNLYCLNTLQYGACPEACQPTWVIPLKETGSSPSSYQIPQTPQLVVGSVPTSSCPRWDLSFMGLMLVVTASGGFYIQLPDCIWKTLFSCSHPPLLALTVFPCLFLWRSFNSEGGVWHRYSFRGEHSKVSLSAPCLAEGHCNHQIMQIKKIESP